MSRGLLRSNINSFLAFMFVGSFALGAWLIVWHTAFGKNPVADVLATQMQQYSQN